MSETIEVIRENMHTLLMVSINQQKRIEDLETLVDQLWNVIEGMKGDGR